MTKFNEEQRAAIETSARHVLVLAGAGTGKTTTIIGRCNHLIASGVPEKNILLITFTRKAAGEIRSRIRGSSGRQSQVTASTFHSWAMRLIRLNPHIFHLESPTLIDRDDIVSLFRRYRGQHSSKSIPKAALLADFHSLLINTRLQPSDAAERFGISEEELAVYLDASNYYRDFKRDRGYIDYDDILECVAETLANPKLAKGVGKRFTHVMIDEVQDTNPLQYLIVDALAPCTSLFCVGDDAQSIYGFRGADFESIHGFTTRYPQTSVLKLELNYRSTQEILDVSNWLLDQSPLQYDKRLRSSRGSGTKPMLREFEDPWEQADYVAYSILDAFATEEVWSNNMVLVRSGYSARPIESRFLDAKIPYALIGGQSLFGARHVKDVMSLLRIYANRRDELAWMRYLQLWRGIGEITAERIFRTVGLGEVAMPGLGDGGASLLEVVSDCERTDKYGWTRPIIECLKSDPSPQRLLAAATGALESRLAEVFSSDHWEMRKRDFMYVHELAKKHRTIQGFVDEYLLNPVYEKDLKQSDGADVVKIITIHSAKGLEATRCFVVDVARGMYPKAGLSESQVEEERRVLYVALTRAADELHITRCDRGWSVPRVEGDGAAYFLDNLPLDFVDYDVSSIDDAEDDGEAEVGVTFRF